MSLKSFILTLSCVAFASATPALAENSAAENQAAKAEKKVYCLKVAPMTGSRLGSTECRTKKEWARDGIEVDKVSKKPA